MGLFRFVGEILEREAKQWLVDRAFRAGQQGEPPPQCINPDLQKISDEAYKLGQGSLLNKGASELIKKIGGN